MTYDEAITKTQEDEQNGKIRKKARRHLMRKIYRDVCRKIGCKYCVAYGSCRFWEFKTRVGYNYALFNMKDEDIIKVTEWFTSEGGENNMTDYVNDFIRPKRRKSHQTNTLLDKGLKEGYRNGTLVKPKTRRGKSVSGGR